LVDKQPEGPSWGQHQWAGAASLQGRNNQARGTGSEIKGRPTKKKGAHSTGLAQAICDSLLFFCVVRRVEPFVGNFSFLFLVLRFVNEGCPSSSRAKEGVGVLSENQTEMGLLVVRNRFLPDESKSLTSVAVGSRSRLSVRTTGTSME
jgi:hypothetical protein